MVVAHNNIMLLQDQNEGTMKPLNDSIHVVFPELLGQGMEMCEFVAISLLFLAICTILMRSDRVLIWCRLANIAGTVFLLRAASMFLTTIPKPHTSIECSGDYVETPFQFLQRTVDVYLHGGLYINGVKICGDYMFSGHTSGITLLSLFVCHYTPDSFWPMRLCVVSLNAMGAFFIICAREHYSVDIFIALVVCVLCFNYYHALVQAGTRSSWLYPTYPYAEELREDNFTFQWPLSRPLWLVTLTSKLNSPGQNIHHKLN